MTVTRVLLFVESAATHLRRGTRTHRRRARRWSRSERKPSRYEIKGDKLGLRLLRLRREIHAASRRMYYRRYYYYAFATPLGRNVLTDSRTGFCLLLPLFLPSFCTVLAIRRDLFLVTWRWKLCPSFCDILRLLIRPPASSSPSNRWLLVSVAITRFNYFTRLYCVSLW